MGSRPRRVAILALAFLLGACSAQLAAPRESETPAPPPSQAPTTRPTNLASDFVYLRSVGSGGEASVLVISARTGETVRRLPDGSPSFDRATLYAPEQVNGATQTLVHVLDVASGSELRSFTLEGAYRALWTDSGQPALSRDGRRLVLANQPYKQGNDWVSRFAFVDAASGAIDAALDLKGQSTYGFVAMSPDGRSVYLNQFGEGGTKLRVYDVPSKSLLPTTPTAGAGLTQTGFRSAGVLSPDGRWVFSLDAGSQVASCAPNDGPRCTPRPDEQPYVMALDLIGRRILTAPLPMEQRSLDFEKYLLWSVAVSPDGGTVYAVNPALGVIDEIDAHTMTMRRMGRITVSRSDGGLLASIGRFVFPAADAKRYITGGALLSPTGDTIYAAGYKGVAAVDAHALSSRAVWQADREFDALALTTDGERLYAVSNASGKIAIVATRDGATLGELKIPAYGQTIIRIDSVQ